MGAYLGILIFGKSDLFFTFDVTEEKLRLKIMRNYFIDKESVTSPYLSPVVSGACARDPHKTFSSGSLLKCRQINFLSKEPKFIKIGQGISEILTSKVAIISKFP